MRVCVCVPSRRTKQNHFGSQINECALNDTLCLSVCCAEPKLANSSRVINCRLLLLLLNENCDKKVQTFLSVCFCVLLELTRPQWQPAKYIIAPGYQLFVQCAQSQQAQHCAVSNASCCLRHRPSADGGAPKDDMAADVGGVGCHPHVVTPVKLLLSP